jgi:hypothetical protein
MRTLGQIAILALALGAVTGLSGCQYVGAQPGPDGTSYVFGALEASLPGTPKQVVEAAESVLKEKDFHVSSPGATGVDGEVVAHTALDKKIDIKIERHGEMSCRISIRVGTLGDREMSREIYLKIKAKL